MRTLIIRAVVVAAAIVVFPIAGSAQTSVNISFGTQTGMSVQCTSGFGFYWGETLQFNHISATDYYGNPSPVFRALQVSPYTLTNASKPNMCVQFTPTSTTATGPFSAWITAYYGFYSQYSVTVYATVNFDPPSGFVKPKYVILGVMYAPPGTRSNVQYQNNTALGISSSVSDSFTAGISTTTSSTLDAKIKGVGAAETSSATASYSQTRDTSSSIAVTQTTGSTKSLAGCLDAARGVNHDCDQIFVWLNPILKFKVGSGWIQWGGYDWDMHDPLSPDMDVIAVPVGCLNGHFQSTSMAPTCNAIISGPFQRSWALPNADGSGPALTGTASCVPGSGTDLCNIMAADPFSDPSFTFTPPPGGMYTTADGRFTACNNPQCFASVLFQPNLTSAYTQGYSSASAQSSGVKYTVGFAFETTSTTSFSTMFSQSLKVSTSLSLTHGYSNSTSSSNSSTSNFTVVGPDPGYIGPMQFVVYQDNLYGTFMFNAQ